MAYIVGTTHVLFPNGKSQVASSAGPSWLLILMNARKQKRLCVVVRGYLADAQRMTRTGSWAWNLETKQSVHWSQEHYRLFGFDPAEGIPTDEMFVQRLHPEDRDRVVGAFDRALS